MMKLILESGCCLREDIPFCGKAHGEYAYDLSNLSVNDVIEIANDYTSGGGNRSRIRSFYIVREICVTSDDQFCKLDRYDTSSQAFKVQKENKVIPA